MNIFKNELEIIEAADTISNDKKYENDPLLEEYKQLLTHYKKLVNESIKTIKLTDSTQHQVYSMKKELENLNEYKTYLMHLVAHDIRNPLTSIFLSLSQFKRSISLEPKQERMLNIISSSASSILNLVNQIITEARIDSNQIALNVENFNIGDSIRTAMDNYNHKAERKQQTIQFLPEGDSNILINADRVFIQEIIENLLSNAIKYTPTGKSIFIYLKEMLFSDSREGIQVAIEDQGIGIPESDKQKLFKKLENFKNKPTNDEKSIGLGLYITKKLIDLHKGEIAVETEQGKGSKFIISIPKQC